jgi:hypothetical protein
VDLTLGGRLVLEGTNRIDSRLGFRVGSLPPGDSRHVIEENGTLVSGAHNAEMWQRGW